MSTATLSAPSCGSVKSKGELFTQYLDIFNAVTEAYVYTKSLSLVVAHRLDDDPTTRSEKLTVDGIHFAIDVQHATEEALKNEPELQSAWFAFVAGEKVEPKISQQLVWKCGRIYEARKLAPWKYFVINRYPKRRTP